MEGMDELLPSIQSTASIEEGCHSHLPLSSPIQGTLDSLAQVEHFLHLGKLPAAARLAQSFASSTTEISRAPLLLVRALLFQGRFQQAESICKTVFESLSSESDIAREMRLWHAFLPIYVIGDPTPTIRE